MPCECFAFDFASKELLDISFQSAVVVAAFSCSVIYRQKLLLILHRAVPLRETFIKCKLSKFSTFLFLFSVFFMIDDYFNVLFIFSVFFCFIFDKCYFALRKLLN